MFKEVPGNNSVFISLDLTLASDGNGARCDLPVSNGKVFISLYGNKDWVDLKWLSLLSDFEVRLPEHLILEAVKTIRFTKALFPYKQEKIEKEVMVFTKPIRLCEKYRIVPNFTRYAVSKNGDVFDILKNKNVTCSKKENDYVFAEIYDPKKNHTRSIGVHRLVALAWVKNKNIYNFVVVNHLDGNKANNHYRNLEWIDYSGNSSHAFKIGLRKENQLCRILDIKTKQVFNFQSKLEASAILGVHIPPKTNSSTFLRKTQLVNGRYEVKYDTESDWFYGKIDEPVKASRYIFTVKEPSGNTQVYYGVNSIISQLKLWNLPSASAIEISKRIKKERPDLSLSYVDQYELKNVQSLCLATGKILETKTIKEMAILTGNDKQGIRYRLRKNKRFKTDKYIFRFKTENAWDKANVDFKISAVRTIAENTLTNEQIEFVSLRECSKHFRVDRSTIKRAIEKQIQIGDWRYTELI